MLLHSNGSNTLRLLERKSGSELRYNHHIFFANEDLTRIIKYLLSTSPKDDTLLKTEENSVDETTIRMTLDKLSSAGIPLSFWGDNWMRNVPVSNSLNTGEDEL